MPSVVARTSTYAFLNAAFPFIRELVDKGIAKAILENPSIAKGVYTQDGELKYESRYSE
jgi:alanine dehydrogenase